MTDILKVKITLLEDMLGTVPKSKEVFTDHIQNKAVEKELITQKEVDDELTCVGDLEEKGWTGFMSDENGLFIYNYMIKGFLKNAANVLKDSLKVKALKSKINNFVYINPRKIYFNLKEPDGVLERPLRAETMQGPRVCLSKSDYINAGRTLEFEITILDHKEVTEKLVLELLGFGKFQGLGQWRNASYGSFTFEVI